MRKTKLRPPLCAALLFVAAFGATHHQVSAASIFVSTTQDGVLGTAVNGCSLREALNAINTQSNSNGCTNVGSPYGSNDMIRFNNGVNTITLTQPVNPIATTALGISRPVMIMGNGVAVTRISGGGNPRALFENSSTNFTIRNLTLQGAGTGVRNLADATATLFRVSLQFLSRRAVVNNGNMRMTLVTVSRNPGGGIVNANPTPLNNLPDVSCIINQSCTDFPVGHRPALLTIEDSAILTNGPLQDAEPSPSFFGCGGVINGGGIVQSGPLVQEKLEGGLILNRSRVVGNSAGNNDGGGICNMSAVRITQSEISTNNARRGGGIAILGGPQLLGLLAINRPPFTLFVNSTISGNNASATGGGIFVSDSNSSLTLQFCTILRNRAQGTTQSDAGGIASADLMPANLSTSVLANNTSAANGAAVQNCANLQFQGIFNFFIAGNQATCTLNNLNNITTGDLGLGNLAANGSPRRSHMPSALSRLVDVIPVNNGFCGGSDQRERTRPRNEILKPGNGCDIGAVER